LQQRVKALGARLHCLTITSGGGDRGLAELTRATGGVIRSVTAGERVDLPALELFASLSEPVACEVRASIEGFSDASIVPEPPKLVFHGVPLVLFGATGGPGSGRLCVAWKSAASAQELREPLEIAAPRLGETLKLLQGARWLTALEAEQFNEQNARLARRQEQRVNTLLERVSLDYGLVSRATALVAVIERPGDQPGLLPETQVVPVGMRKTPLLKATLCVRANARLSRGGLAWPPRVRPFLRG